MQSICMLGSPVRTTRPAQQRPTGALAAITAVESKPWLATARKRCVAGSSAKSTERVRALSCTACEAIMRSTLSSTSVEVTSAETRCKVLSSWNLAPQLLIGLLVDLAVLDVHASWPATISRKAPHPR